jgi:hypothetical protein
MQAGKTGSLRKPTPRQTPVAERGSHFFLRRKDCSKRPEAVADGVRQRVKELGGPKVMEPPTMGRLVRAARLREWLLAAGALLFWAAHCFPCASTVHRPMACPSHDGVSKPRRRRM